MESMLLKQQTMYQLQRTSWNLSKQMPRLEENKGRKNKGKGRGEKTHSQAATSTTNQALAPQNKLTNINFDRDMAATILTCMIHAHMTNNTKPGSYNNEINKLFKMNKLPNVFLPDNPPSLDTLKMANSRTEEENEENESEDGENSREEVEQTEEMPQLEQISGKAIGLEIITKKSRG